MKQVRLDSLFDIQSGNGLALNDLDEGSIPFVSRGEKNNGIVAYVKKENLSPFPGHCITVALSGSVLESFYQDQPFYTAYHIAVLYPKSEMSREVMFFYCTCIRKNKYRYSYGRQANKTMRSLLVPSLDYAENIASKIPTIKKPSAEILKQSAIEIDVRNWQAFRYDEIFSISKGYFQRRPEVDESVDAPRNIPFIGATEKRNGVTSWLSVPEISQQDDQLIQPKADGPIYNANSITVSNNGSVGYAFFQSVPFTCSIDVNVLYLLDNKIISPYLAMFLCTAIELDRYRWNYGRKWTARRMANSIIKLPTDKEGSPDWEFMENFIKSQPYTASL